MTAPTETCGRCFFARLRPGEAGYVACQRFPPRIITAAGALGYVHTQSRFPRVSDESWCGEWRQRREDRMPRETVMGVARETAGGAEAFKARLVPGAPATQGQTP